MRDGLTIREAEASDEAAVRAFLERLSADSRWKRYHNAAPRVMPWMIDPVVRPDHVDHEALLAIVDGTVVGIAEWGRAEPDGSVADMAVVVSEDCRRHGIARALIRHLARNAHRHGVDSFSGSILSMNRASIALLRNVASEYTSSFDGGTLDFVAPLQVPA